MLQVWTKTGTLIWCPTKRCSKQRLQGFMCCSAIEHNTYFNENFVKIFLKKSVRKISMPEVICASTPLIFSLGGASFNCIIKNKNTKLQKTSASSAASNHLKCKYHFIVISHCCCSFSTTHKRQSSAHLIKCKRKQFKILFASKLQISTDIMQKTTN